MFLQVRNIHKSFGEGEARAEVLKGIDFACARGEFCVLLGPSGCGKSTLLNIIGGIDVPDEGDVLIAGEGMAGMGFASCAVVLALEMRRIKGIPMSEALSDVD